MGELKRSRRDYEPAPERNVSERMGQGASAQEGLAGRMTATKDGAFYRTYIDEQGQERPEKKWRNSNVGIDW